MFYLLLDLYRLPPKKISPLSLLPCLAITNAAWRPANLLLSPAANAPYFLVVKPLEGSDGEMLYH